MNFLQPNSRNSKSQAASPELVDFARDMATAEFGRHYPSEGSDGFRDRAPPEIEAPDVSAPFRRGRHRQFPSLRSAE